MSKLPLPRPPRNAQPDAAQLDDLLQFSEAPAAVRRPQPKPWLVVSLIQAFLLSAVAYTLFAVANLDPPYALLLALSLGVVLVRRAAKMTAEPESRRVVDAVRAPARTGILDVAGWYEGGDGMRDAIRRWDRRLEWGSGSPDRFQATVVDRLGELADDRLRLRHFITRTSDPVRARALLGEELWRLLHEPLGRVPRPREIAAAAERLETL
jgi:hypothetical protein